MHSDFPSTDNQASSACAGCAIRDRRTFIRDAATAVATLLGLSMADSSVGYAQIAALATPANGNADETLYPIPTADGVSIDTKHETIIARAGSSVYAFSLSCPHQNTALRWLDKDKRFQCPKHKSKYKPDGEFISGRATRNMDRLPIKRVGNNLVVDTSVEIRSDEQPASWAAAVVNLAS